MPTPFKNERTARAIDPKIGVGRSGKRIGPTLAFLYQMALCGGQ